MKKLILLAILAILVLSLLSCERKDPVKTKIDALASIFTFTSNSSMIVDRSALKADMYAILDSQGASLAVLNDKSLIQSDQMVKFNKLSDPYFLYLANDIYKDTSNKASKIIFENVKYLISYESLPTDTLCIAGKVLRANLNNKNFEILDATIFKNDLEVKSSLLKVIADLNGSYELKGELNEPLNLNGKGHPIGTEFTFRFSTTGYGINI